MGSPLINIGELSKPATVLVKRVSDLFAGYFKPYQMKRIASAEVEADRIRSLGQIETEGLCERAVRRFVADEMRKQENIEAITNMALPDVRDDAKPDNIDEDWLTNFFEQCKNISDEQMQALWSRLLSGQANTPGQFSRRTVNFVASLDTQDAKIFKSFCGFIVNSGDLPLIYEASYEDSIYSRNDINFRTLEHLDAIGLIKFSAVTEYRLSKAVTLIPIQYFHETYLLQTDAKEPVPLDIGSAVLTNVGIELARICNPQPITGFVEYLAGRWLEQGMHISCPLSKPANPTSD
ncbi:MAG: DUF2806 domain-containing protein [Phycisphaerales bacterium]